MEKSEYFVLKIPKSALPRTFHPEKGKFSLIFSGSELLILKRKETITSEGPVYMTLWGDIRSFLVPEVLDILHLSMKSGILNFDFEDNIQKTLYLRNGEVIFAQSSIDDDRLGETLIREGKITKEQFIEASKEVGPGKHFGSILVEKGFIRPGDLDVGIKTQLEGIIISLFQYKKGKFYFLEGKDIVDDIQRVDINIEELIVKGIKTTPFFIEVMDESNLGYIVTVVLDYNPDAVMLNPLEEKIVSYISEEGGETSLLSILRALQIREVTLFITLLRLAKKKIILIQKSQARTVMEVESEITDQIEREFGRLNQFLSQVILLLEKQGKDEVFRVFINDAISSVVDDLKSIFEHVQMYRDGTLNVGVIVENLGYKPLKERRSFAERSISWLVSKILEWGRKNGDEVLFKKIEFLVKKFKENAR